MNNLEMQYQLTQPAHSARWQSKPFPPQGTPSVESDGTDLADGKIWSHDLVSEALDIYCTRGAVWITQTGSSDDVVLRAGQTFRASGKGKVVVQALGDAMTRVSEIAR